MVGSIDKLDILLAEEKVYLRTVNRSKAMERVRREQKAILGMVREIGKQNDLDTTIKAEKRSMVRELTNHANSPEMVSSLKAGIGELEAAEYYIALVRNPERYQQYAKGMTLAVDGGAASDQAHGWDIG